MLNVHHPKKEEIAVVVFSKKNAYLDYKIITQFLVEQKGSKNYGKSVSIKTFLFLGMTTSNLRVYFLPH
jgi:hypothetical protein